MKTRLLDSQLKSTKSFSNEDLNLWKLVFKLFLAKVKTSEHSISHLVLKKNVMKFMMQSVTICHLTVKLKRHLLLNILSNGLMAKCPILITLLLLILIHNAVHLI